jgi:hypothetical protein
LADAWSFPFFRDVVLFKLNEDSRCLGVSGEPYLAEPTVADAILDCLIHNADLSTSKENPCGR